MIMYVYLMHLLHVLTDDMNEEEVLDLLRMKEMRLYLQGTEGLSSKT